MVPPPTWTCPGRKVSSSSCRVWWVPRLSWTQPRFRRSKSMRLATITWVSSAAPIAASQPSPGTSSASQNATAGARAAAIPILRANGLPRSAEASTARMASPGWAAEKLSNTARVASVEPLSASTISHGRSQLWEASPSRVSPSVAAPLRQAMTTLIAGTWTFWSTAPPAPPWTSRSSDIPAVRPRAPSGFRSGAHRATRSSHTLHQT